MNITQLKKLPYKQSFIVDPPVSTYPYTVRMEVMLASDQTLTLKEVSECLRSKKRFPMNEHMFIVEEMSLY